MANREALRELQTRLAERMLAARGTTPPQSWLAVECAGRGLLFPLAQAGEIFALPPLMPVPHTQPWFLGVANLRGSLHGVVDLAVLFGLERTAAPADGAQLVALNPALEVNAALLVDRLAGLRSAGQLVAEAMPQARAPAFAGACWRDAEGRRWQEVELAKLAADQRFLRIVG